MLDLPVEIQQQLADLSDGEWAALAASLRAPDGVEQLRAAASKVLSGDQLTAWVESVDPSKFAGDDGEIDEDKVMGRLTALFGQQGGNGSRLGDGGRAEARKRFGGNGNGHESAEQPAVSSFGRRGAAGRAEAERRFGKAGQR